MSSTQTLLWASFWTALNNTATQPSFPLFSAWFSEDKVLLGGAAETRKPHTMIPLPSSLFLRQQAIMDVCCCGHCTISKGNSPTVAPCLLTPAGRQAYSVFPSFTCYHLLHSLQMPLCESLLHHLHMCTRWTQNKCGRGCFQPSAHLCGFYQAGALLHRKDNCSADSWARSREQTVLLLDLDFINFIIESQKTFVLVVANESMFCFGIWILNKSRVHCNLSADPKL